MVHGATSPGSTSALLSRFYTGEAEPVGEHIDLGLGEAVVFTTPSPLHPDRNEDGAAVLRLGASALIAVADGVGGLPGGESASTLALEQLGQSVADLPAEPDATTLRNAVLDGFERGHRAIRSEGSGGATTLTAVTIRDGYLRSFNAGDSAAMIVGADGGLKLQTVPHSPVGYALESGLIDEDEALAHENRNVIFNCLGLERMHVEFTTGIVLDPRDTVLLGTDGLFDNLTQDELIGLLAGESLDTICTELAQTAGQRMLGSSARHPSKPDDLTFAAFRVR